MSGYLTFGELKESECFISVPVEGDDKGHGGLKGAHFIFMKIKTTGKDNAIRRKDGILSFMPDSMPVIKVQ